MKTRICEHCEKEFTPSRGPCKSRPAQRFCSVACKGKVYRGPLVPNFKGGSITRDGYRMMWSGGRRIQEHRLVMEAHLGRALLPTEVIHHKDHDRLNNAIENLELMASPSVHRLAHYTGYRTETHKQCKKCLEIKPRTEFHGGRKGRPTLDPNHTQCKPCRADYYAARHRAGKTSERRPDDPNREYSACSTCGTTKGRLRVKGMCRPCYRRQKRHFNVQSNPC